MNIGTNYKAIKQDYQPDSFEKGFAFEGYIIKLFNENSFRLEKWRRAEKFPDGIFVIDHSFPDLELVFVGSKKYRFAIECKWRKEFIEGKIDWANRNQIGTYEDFQNKKRMPVFIAIGIGGEPCKPEKLFVTPLDNISGNTDVYDKELIPYKRKPTRNFFYDTNQLKLF